MQRLPEPSETQNGIDFRTDQAGVVAYGDDAELVARVHYNVARRLGVTAIEFIPQDGELVLDFTQTTEAITALSLEHNEIYDLLAKRSHSTGPGHGWRTSLFMRHKARRSRQAAATEQDMLSGIANRYNAVLNRLIDAREASVRVAGMPEQRDSA